MATIDQILQVVQRLEMQQADTTKSHTAIKGAILGVQNEIVNVKTDMSTIHAKINTIQTDLGSVQAGLAATQTKVSTIETGLRAMQVDLNTLQTDLGTVQASVTTIESTLASSGGGSGTGTGGSGGAGGSGSGGGGPPPPPPPPPPIHTPFMFDPSQGFSIPVYESGKMSPDSFLSEVTEFFTLKGVPKTQWHILISRFFNNDSDISRWWRAKKPTIKSWTAFCTAFKNYESVDFNYDLLVAKLYERRQRIDEAFEAFAWDIHGAFMKIDTHTPDQTIVDRIMSACLPELSSDLRALKCTTVEKLVTQARVLIADLNRTRRLERKTLLRARQSDPIYKPEIFTKRTFHKHSEKPSQKDPSNENANDASSDKTSSDKNEKKKLYCTFCKRDGHDTAACRRKAYSEKQKQAQAASSTDGAQADKANLNQ